MSRRFGGLLAVVALLFGWSAAPYTHAHHAIESASAGHHPHGDTLVHTHASPHSHRDADHSDAEPAGQEESDEQIRGVDSFVFQQSVPGHAPSPVLLVMGEPHVRLTSIWLGAPRMQPQAHGPPVGAPPGLRAPPA